MDIDLLGALWSKTSEDFGDFDIVGATPSSERSGAYGVIYISLSIVGESEHIRDRKEVEVTCDP